MIDNQFEIGVRLKAIRDNIGLTQYIFGVLIGIDDKSTISKYEKGLMPIAKKAEVELFTTLGVNKQWLYKGEGKMISDEDKFLSVLKAQKRKDDLDFLLSNTAQNARDRDLQIEEFEEGKKVIAIDASLFIEIVPLISTLDSEYCSKYNDNKYIASLPKYCISNIGQTNLQSSSHVAFINNGRDMENKNYNSIKDTDILVCTELNSPDSLAVYHEIAGEERRFFVIIHKEKILVRCIKEYNNKDKTLICDSISESGIYPNIKLKYEDINQIFLVRRIERNLK